MPNALILEYQKSRIRHTPSHLRPSGRTTGSFFKVVVFNTVIFVKDFVFNTRSFVKVGVFTTGSFSSPALRSEQVTN
jgi:hypothetical protein